MVQQAEASVQQLETEVAEDRQAVQQLQQNVADTLAHVKALQNSLNPSIPARNGTKNYVYNFSLNRIFI